MSNAKQINEKAILHFSNLEVFKAVCDNGEFVARNVTLFVACNTAKSIGNGDIVRDGRLVAFFSEWTKHIHVGFGANSLERAAIVDAFGEAPAL